MEVNLFHHLLELKYNLLEVILSKNLHLLREDGVRNM